MVESAEGQRNLALVKDRHPALALLEYKQMFGLAEALNSLRAEAVVELPDAVLGADIVELSTLIDRLEAERLRRLAVYRQRRGFLVDGAFSTVAWLRWRCRMRVSRARSLEEMDARLVDLPTTAAGWQLATEDRGEFVAIPPWQRTA